MSHTSMQITVMLVGMGENPHFWTRFLHRKLSASCRPSGERRGSAAVRCSYLADGAGTAHLPVHDMGLTQFSAHLRTSLAAFLISKMSQSL